MTTIASQITSLTVVYSTVYSDADQSKHQSSASLAFVWGIHRDRWIPRTKGQLRGKFFHLMTSSWTVRSQLGRISIKRQPFQVCDFHYKDKMVMRKSYLYNGNSHTWKDHLYIETVRPQDLHLPEYGDLPREWWHLSFHWLIHFKMPRKKIICILICWRPSQLGLYIEMGPWFSVWQNHRSGRGFSSQIPGYTNRILHYIDITWASWCVQSPATQLLVQQLVQATMKKQQSYHITSHLWSESASNWWILLTKDQ